MKYQPRRPRRIFVTSVAAFSALLLIASFAAGASVGAAGGVKGKPTPTPTPTPVATPTPAPSPSPITSPTPIGAPPNPDPNWNGGGSTNNWTDAANWSNGTPYNTYGTVEFGSLGAGAQGTTSVVNQSVSQNNLLWTGSLSWILNNSGGAVISLFDFGGTQAKVENQSTGLVTINAPITFAATAGARWGEINAVNGSILFGTGTLTVNGSQVDGIRLFGGSAAGISTTFNNTVNATGKYFSTSAVGQTINVGGTFNSGDFYLMNSGTLNYNAGTLNTSAIRLGGDFGNTGTQNLTLGATFALTPAAGGLTYANVINTVAGNTSGSLLIDSKNTSGTNTLSGHLALDSNLKINQAAGGTLNITQVHTGADTSFVLGTDIKGNTLTFGGAGNFGVSGTIYNSTGSGSVNMSGSGILTLSSTNTYNGSLNLNSGIVSVDTHSELGATTSNVNFNGGTLRITGSTTFDSGLSRSFTETASGGTIDTNRTVLSNIQGAFTSVLGAPAMNKTGTGQLRLSGTADNTNLGFNVNGGTLTLNKTSTSSVHAIGTLTTIGNGGTLLLGNSSGDQIFNSAGITVNGGGTFNTGGFSEGVRPSAPTGGTAGSAGMGALTLQNTTSASRAIFDFVTGANGSTLAFSSLAGGSGAFVNILNWTGTAFTDSGATGNDRLLFATDPGLTNAQLANWTFFNDSGTAFGVGATEIVYGNMWEIVPIPEPSTWVAGILTVLAVGYTQRKRALKRGSRNAECGTVAS